MAEKDATEGIDKNEKDDQFENDDDEEDEEIGRLDYTEELIKACIRNDEDAARKFMDKKQTNINKEDAKKKWTPLIWACCKGSEGIVRLLIQRGAQEQYILQSNQTVNKVQMGNINNNIRPSPLLWAVFKAHLGIVQQLLKAGLRWDEIDAVGNNSLHLAASSSSVPVFTTLLAYGVTLSQKNTRGHTVLDLATEPAIIHLILQHEETKQCSFCNLQFNTSDSLNNATSSQAAAGMQSNEAQLKHYCSMCKKFFCKNCFSIKWVYQSHESQFAEELRGRCTPCLKFIQKHEEELQEKMTKNVHADLSAKLQEIKDKKIEVESKLHQRAVEQLEMLRTQNVIKDFIHKLEHVPNYKTILKSLNVINDMLKDAKQRNITLDADVAQHIETEKKRLSVERDLRFQLDNLVAYKATQEEVTVLKGLYDRAKELNVAQEYMVKAEKLLDRMQKNLQAKAIFEMFKDYPEREYPMFVIYDPKTKKPLDPVTRKPVDPKLLAPPKKKGKKEPKFVIPEWAGEIPKLQEKINQVESLIKQNDELQLGEVFLTKSVDLIARMKKEVRYRKQLDEEAKIIAEKKAAEKKKNK